MKFIISALACGLLWLSASSQVAIGINAGIGSASKLLYASNKGAIPVGANVLFTTNHFEGGLALTYFKLSDKNYSSVTDIGVVANGKIPLNNSFENRGSYMTLGGGIGYGTADFGGGLVLGLQAAYGYRLNEHIALTVAIAPRFYNFSIKNEIYSGKWKSLAGVYSTDRFLIVPLAIGINFIL